MNKTLIVFLMAAGAAMAQDGRQIIQEVQKRQHSASLRYEGTAKTYGGTSPIPAEVEKHTLIKRWTFERIGDFGNSKALLRFTGPAEVKGVAVLILNHPNTTSDQWMWRPNIGRDQRVSAQDRSTRFFGTDFSFEDLEERDVDQYDYTLTGEASGAWRIDAKPRKPSQYTHSYFYIDKTNYTYNRIEAYNKKGVAKTIDYTDYKMVQGKWTPSAVLVYDAFAKSKTVLTYDKVEYDLPLKDEDFTVEALRRGE
jgi:outer membrane lipoprotein-sorting protein